MDSWPCDVRSRGLHIDPACPANHLCANESCCSVYRKRSIHMPANCRHRVTGTEDNIVSQEDVGGVLKCEDVYRECRVSGVLRGKYGEPCRLRRVP